MSNVSGVFTSQAQADSAVSRLVAEGFKNDDISLLITDQGKKTLFRDVNKDNEKVTTGAVSGGVLGALAAGAIAITAIAVPGVSLLAAGPIAAALSSAGVGAAAGSITGALVGAGFDKAEVAGFEDDLKAGRAIVIVNTSKEKEARARAILSQGGSTQTKVA